METGIVGREKPRPRPEELIIRIFAGELMGQGDGNSVLLIALPDGMGFFHLLNDFGHERGGQGHNPVLAALGPDEKQHALFQIHILDSQIEGFRDAQAATVNQAGDQTGGITRPVLNGLEQGLGFRHGGRMSQTSRTFGAESIHPLQRLAQDFLVKIENGVERLILAAGGQIAVAGQMGEEKLQFFLAGKGGGHGREGGNILAEPMDVGGFSCEGHVLAAQDIAEAFDGEMQIHNDVSLTGSVGQRLSKATTLDQRTTGSFIQNGFVDYETLARK